MIDPSKRMSVKSPSVSGMNYTVNSTPVTLITRGVISDQKRVAASMKQFNVVRAEHSVCSKPDADTKKSLLIKEQTGIRCKQTIVDSNHKSSKNKSVPCSKTKRVAKPRKLACSKSLIAHQLHGFQFVDSTKQLREFDSDVNMFVVEIDVP